MGVGEWLRNLGLGQYEPAFVESAVDFDVLPELTEDDLAKLGVRLGDRKRLIRAIKATMERAGDSPAVETTEAQERQDGHLAIGGAERRHLTVMICDLVELHCTRAPA